VVSRFLVTTALEETWPPDNVPVLFLGEWCRRYDRQESWKKRDATIAPYHWDDREKLHKDYGYLQTLHEELLGELAAKLNAMHAVNYSVRYWRILVGPWLGYFVQMLFDRWTMLKLATKDADISGVHVLRNSGEALVPNDMADFTSMFVGDAWNEAVYGQLLACMPLKIEAVDPHVETYLPDERTSNEKTREKIRILLEKIVNSVSSVVSRDGEIFLIESYFSANLNVRLQIRLGQIPRVWCTVRPPSVGVQPSMRRWEVEEPVNTEDFSSVAWSMISRHLPTAYLEGYQALVAVTKKLRWPKRPAVIFTSNSYSADDVFKAWAAGKVEQGAALLLGQHGGNMGMAKWAFYEEHQIAISDHFLTWGWRQSNQRKVHPVGNLTDFRGQAAADGNGLGVALLVELGLPRFSYHMYSVPVAGQWLDYFQDQCRFVEALPEVLRGQVLVRLCAQDYGWCQKQRWRDHFPKIRLDEGIRPMASLVKKARIYVSTYNATTYLESLALNIPTIMFWNPCHWEMRDSVIPFFEKLKAVGIFHETPEGAARQMALVWNDVRGWWDNEDVQSARREFIEEYSRSGQAPLMVLEKLFREAASRARLMFTA
jgi:putative transferase (TIGR04331 family)